MRPPEQSPQQYYDSLLDVPAGLADAIYAVFVGSISGVQNQIVRIESNVLRLVNAGSQMHWVFDYDAGVCVIDSTSISDYANKIINASGRPYTAGPAIVVSDISIFDISYKLSPI